MLIRIFILIFVVVLAAPGIQAQIALSKEQPGPAGSELPLSLKDSVHQALARNPLVSEAKLGVRAGERAVDSAQSRHLPRLFLDSNYTNREDPLPYIPAQAINIAPHFSNEFASWSLLLTIPVYQGGQISRNVDLAKIRKYYQEQNLSQTKNEIIANTINTYNKILQIQKLREAVRSSVSALEIQKNNAELLFKVGRIARVDLLKVDVQLANEKQRLFSLDEALTNLGNTLFYLMGETPVKAKTIPPLSDTLRIIEFKAEFNTGLADAKNKRPEYLVALKSVQEAEVNRSLAKGKLFPTVNAFGGYLDQYGFDPWYKEANWFAGVNMSIPIFEKSIYDDITREGLLKEKASNRLASVENQLRLDLQNAISALEESRGRILATSQSVGQAEESFRIEGKKYSSGAGTMVDMLLAESAYISAAANNLQALFDYNAAIVNYQKTTGTLGDYYQ